MRRPSRRTLIGSLGAACLVVVAALHVFVVGESFVRALNAPSPDELGMTSLHHWVDLGSSLAYLALLACCGVLVAHYLQSGRTALARRAPGLWTGAALAGGIAAVALGAEAWSAAVDYQWSFSDYRERGDVGALLMDFIGVYALSFPVLVPVACLWFERLET